jgi:peptidoglycan DL-endopeptidase LytE
MYLTWGTTTRVPQHDKEEKKVTKRDWIMKSTVAVMLSTSLLMGGQMGQVAAASTTYAVNSVDIASIAKQQIGKPYKYQSNGPSSFGSANLATYVYGQAGIKIGNSLSSLYKTGTSVSQNNLQAGDLVFFSSKGKGSPTFMGIYIGNDQFVYSSQSEGEVVLKSFSDFENKFVGARRVIGSESSEDPSNNSESSTNATADQVIANGEKYLGTKYKYGSSSNTTSTFDCSSFTQRVFKEAGITLPRDSRQQSTVGTTVSKSDLQKGDLVFMKASPTSSSDRITHVAIYAGDGKILHTYGSPGVTYSKFFGTNWEKRVVKIKRVI